MKTRTVSIVSTTIVLAVMIFLFYQISTLRKENRLLQELVSRKGGASSGRNGDPYISGAVKNRILKGTNEIKKCYRDHTARKGKVREGNIKVDWQIETGGSAIRPEIVFSQFGAPEFEQCIIASIARWKFPEPIVKKYVSHTFHFRDAKETNEKKGRR